MIYYWDNKLKKRLHVLKAEIITINKNIDLMSLAQRMHFLQDMFQITAIALISLINHYHINGLHLFWDTLYLTHRWTLTSTTIPGQSGPGNNGNEEVWHNGNKQTFVPLGSCCDPAVVKDDECKKLFNNPKVYLLLQVAGSRQEKERVWKLRWSR